MDQETKKSDLKKSKFKDSKVDIKEVFSEKTDLQSRVDDISTFSNIYSLSIPQLTLQRKASPAAP